MADVSKITGPSGSPDKPEEKKKSADAAKFQEAVKRVGKVTEVDPDEQKKRKQAEETGEEDVEGAVAATPTPPGQVTPFSMEPAEQKTSPLEMQSGGPGTSPLTLGQPTQTPPLPTTTFFQTPAPDELSDDSQDLEEDAFNPSPSSASAAQQQPQAQSQGQQPQTQAQPQQTQQPWTPEGQEPVTPGPPGSPSQQAASSQPSQPQDDSSQQDAKGQQPGQAGPGFSLQTPSKATQPSLTQQQLEQLELSKLQDTSTFFEQMGQKDQDSEQRKQPQTEEQTEEKIESIAEGAGAPATAAPFSLGKTDEESKGVEEKEKSSAAQSSTGQLASVEAQTTPISPPGPESLPPYANISPQVQDVFDRMVGTMSVMTMQGVSETTITLNAPQFASSVFFGTQIIIQEYSTAPQAYNIQLSGTPQAVALFQENVDDLMAAFQSGNYNFRVNRLETSYLSDRPLFKRKEGAAKDNSQKGDNSQ